MPSASAGLAIVFAVYMPAQPPRLAVPDRPDLHLVVYTAAPGRDIGRKLDAPAARADGVASDRRSAVAAAAADRPCSSAG
jgi:hypothetical protein